MNLEDLVKNYPKNEKMREIDLVIDGGSFNGTYTMGGLILIKKLENLGYLKVVRISGCSVGSLLGVMYFNNNLDDGFVFDKKLRENLKDKLNLNLVKSLIKDEINKMDNDIFSEIKNDKLFIAYFNNGKNRKIKYIYKNKEELINSLMKSCHVPYLIDNNYYCEKGDSIDGIYAHIFDKLERETIFFDNTNISTMFNLKNEINSSERLMEGMLKTHKLLLKNEPSNICNYLNNWNNTDYLKRNLKLFFAYIIVKIISTIHDFIILFNDLIFRNKDNNLIHGELDCDLNNLFNNCLKKICLSYIFS